MENMTGSEFRVYKKNKYTRAHFQKDLNMATAHSILKTMTGIKDHINRVNFTVKVHIYGRTETSMKVLLLMALEMDLESGNLTNRTVTFT